MSDYTELMGELLELGVNANPASPYTACILDASGQILITACNACHISPLYSAEGLALHLLASEFDCQQKQPLIMITTVEPDDLSLMAIYRAHCQGTHIDEITYGASRAVLKKLWPSDPSQGLAESLKHFPDEFSTGLNIHGQVLADECLEAFKEGKDMFDRGDDPVRSMDIDQYWMAGDWLIDDWEENLE